MMVIFAWRQGYSAVAKLYSILMAMRRKVADDAALFTTQELALMTRGFQNLVLGIVPGGRRGVTWGVAGAATPWDL